MGGKAGPIRDGERVECGPIVRPVGKGQPSLAPIVASRSNHGAKKKKRCRRNSRERGTRHGHDEACGRARGRKLTTCRVDDRDALPRKRRRPLWVRLRLRVCPCLLACDGLPAVFCLPFSAWLGKYRGASALDRPCPSGARLSWAIHPGPRRPVLLRGHEPGHASLTTATDQE